jgi:hypothetical protein
LLSPEVEQVHSAFGVDPDNGVDGVIASVSGDSVIRSAIDPQRIECRRFLIRPQPFCLEVVAVRWRVGACWYSADQSRGTDRQLDPVQRWTSYCSGQSALPSLSIAGRLRISQPSCWCSASSQPLKSSSCQRVWMITTRPPGIKPRVSRRSVPILGLLADDLRIRVFAVLYRIIDQQQMSAAAR